MNWTDFFIIVRNRKTNAHLEWQIMWKGTDRRVDSPIFYTAGTILSWIESNWKQILDEEFETEVMLGEITKKPKDN